MLNFKKIISLFTVIPILMMAFMVSNNSKVLASSSSVSSPGYNPSYLIDDSIFTNASTMSVNDIQTFLTNEGSGLQSYSTVEACNPSTPVSPDPWASSYYPNCGKTELASQIIYDAAQAYSINPQVILATIEKEQSLVTTPNPTQSQLNCAMGYDSCSSLYVGFFTQIDNGTWQLRTDLQLMGGVNWWGYSPSNYACATSQSGYYNNGLYPGNTVTFNDSGGTAETVTLADFSTAALYCYTPYVGPISVTGYSGSYNFVNYFEEWFGPTTSSSGTNELNFINLSYYTGSVQDVGYPSISEYYYISRNFMSSYPSVVADGSVIPLYRPNGDLCFVRLNYSGGDVQIVCYTQASEYTQIDLNTMTGYPDVATNGDVVPLFNPNGDLTFIRLNYSGGDVQLVSYSSASNFTHMDYSTMTAYPDVPSDGSVKVLYSPSSGDLCFVRLNYSGGNTQIVCYTQSGYDNIAVDTMTGYPDVPINGSVIPLFTPEGDLSFLNIAYSSGNVQVVDFTQASNYQTADLISVTGYPDVSPDGPVYPLYSL